MREKMLERFFRYVKIDTQSQENIEDRYPSTEKQKDLLNLLVVELKELGLKDAEMDKYGYVTATFPGNVDHKTPTIGFIAHVDTSPDVSGKNVKPIIHKNYNRTDLVLPGDKSQVIKFAENPDLKDHIGDDIITSDGTTLLGADNKAGIAEIITMIEYLKAHPEIKHGPLRIGFTPDEEVGCGTKYFDVKKFNADFAYTVDGEKLGEIEDETFNAAVGIFNITGVSVHPGYAKNKLVNGIRIASEVVTLLNAEPSPESTEKREGYLHPYSIEGGTENATLKVLLRDFDKDGMESKKVKLNQIRDKVAAKFPKGKVELEIKEQYENMKVKLDENKKVVEYALEAVKRSGITPNLQLIRGGTDGARLSFMGLLTPNIFTAGHNFHSKLEWISIQGMEKAVETLVNLVQLWAEK